MRPIALNALLTLLALLPAAQLLERAAERRARIVDLTYPLSEKTPHWPGPRYRPFKFEAIASLDKDGVFSGQISMPEHIGTHLDAPNHFVAGQVSVDKIPPEQLIGPAAVIDVSAAVQSNPDYRLSVQDIERWEKSNGRLPEGVILLARTGWSRFWNDFEKYKNQDRQGVLHFPGFSREAAEFLVRRRSVKGIGIDTLSVDYGPSRDFIVHHIMHGAGKYHLENLANLDKLPARGAFLVAAPIKIEGGSGGPARVFAFLD